MHKTLLSFLFILAAQIACFSQSVKISIVSPRILNDRRAILLTREKGFAAIVHSIQLGFDTTHLKMDKSLLPDLYQLQVSQLKGALTFFFEPGTVIRLDTGNVSRSPVTNSRSNREWQLFNDSIQKPSDLRANQWVLEEARARKKNQPDSVQYWLEKQRIERAELLAETAAFIRSHPQSYVSLYLLKINWYAFKNLGLLELLDKSLSTHRNYAFLRAKKQEYSGSR
ncbi:hypothetical protein [Dyadobacter crusticola]|uniref:hypothetical protein n=1 Tax=Dyadobacter crusticola TaxID=292407 RepID=UPI0004E27545|nr:hypothetical protein [Dyadobacter crusticola]